MTNPMNVPFPEHAMKKWGEAWWTGEQVAAYGDARDEAMRRAIRNMTAVLKNREWAEHVSADPDITALEAEISELVGRVNAAPVSPV